MARCVMGLLQDLAQVLRGSGSGLETLRPVLGLPGLEKLVVFYPACETATNPKPPALNEVGLRPAALHFCTL